MLEKKTFLLINHYGSSPDTGMGGRTFYMAKALHEHGHKIIMVCASFNHKLSNPKKFSGPYEIDRSHGFKIIRIKVPTYSHSFSKQRVFNWFMFGYRLIKFYSHFIDEVEVVVCSSPSLLSFFPAERIARVKKAELVFEVRDIWPLTLLDLGNYSDNHFFIRFLKWVEKRAYSKSDVVISNLPNAVEHMVRCGMEPSKFHWIPNGFDRTTVNALEKLDAKIESQLPVDKFIIGYTGSIGEANALSYLIEAAKLLTSQKNIAFVIVGKGKEQAFLKKSSKQLKNVHFINSISKSQVQSMLSKFDVCYLGWKDKSLYKYGIAPNKLPEYMFSGRPILHSYSGKFDLVKITKSGISVPAENPEAIAQAVLDFEKLPEKYRHEMGARGRKYVNQRQDYRILASQMLALLT